MITEIIDGKICSVKMTSCFGKVIDSFHYIEDDKTYLVIVYPHPSVELVITSRFRKGNIDVVVTERHDVVGQEMNRIVETVKRMAERIK